jgi:hypothetical protein
MTVVASEALDKSRSGARAAGLGIAAAIAVSLAMLLHLLFWELVNCNGDDCPPIVLSDFGAFSKRARTLEAAVTAQHQRGAIPVHAQQPGSVLDVGRRNLFDHLRALGRNTALKFSFMMAA